jgi:hypothetical protein
VLKDGTALRSLADVRRFILNEPEHVQECRAWQRATEPLLHAADDASQIEAATRQVELALFLEARLLLR